jgi:hypothetical protein
LSEKLFSPKEEGQHKENRSGLKWYNGIMKLPSQSGDLKPCLKGVDFIKLIADLAGTAGD